MAETHSFDIVCKIEMHEVNNAVDQAKKQLAVRYDFKGSKSSLTLNSDNSITAQKLLAVFKLNPRRALNSRWNSWCRDT